MVGTSCVVDIARVGWCGQCCSGGRSFRKSTSHHTSSSGGREKMRRCLNTRKSITQDCTQQLLFSREKAASSTSINQFYN
eukprot:scaffold10606_cov84-Skeletonema_marinoi.AAC.2